MQRFQEQNSSRITERDEQIKVLYDQIVEVNELTKDLLTLTKQQQGILDRIDQNLSATQEHTANAVDQLQKAEKHQKQCIVC